jgi:tRNA-splicing ligase RtcB
VSAVTFADEALIRAMDQKVYEQAVNVASLHGIVKDAYAMPDAHWDYGFPIGGVAASDPDDGGVISAGGVGFDISCGVRGCTPASRVPTSCRSRRNWRRSSTIVCPQASAAPARYVLARTNAARCHTPRGFKNVSITHAASIRPKFSTAC